MMQINNIVGRVNLEEKGYVGGGSIHNVCIQIYGLSSGPISLVLFTRTPS